jgi:hypothetical protein
MMSPLLSRVVAACAFALLLPAAGAGAQSLQTKPRRPASSRVESPPDAPGDASAPEEVRRELRDQRAEIELLRAALAEQSRALEELRARVERAERREVDAARRAHVAEALYAPAGPAAPARSRPGERTDEKAADATTRNAQGPTAPKPAETTAGAASPITFSGDIRFRYESFYNQQNTSASAGAPGALGNPLSTRQRLRVRARLAARGKIGEEFEWGLRLTTGSFPDVASGNQTFTDFFSHKTFALDQAFITYKPARLPGLQVQGGKFETPWWRTELAWDNDLSPEGLNQRYSHRPRNSKLRELTVVAWQLPFLERNSAFVLGADGRVDFEASRRGGRDLALYGGQARVEVAPSAGTLLRLAVADNYYSGTQFINPAQFFGANVQFPVTVNLPATETTPARAVTGTATVPRELLTSGNANLGVSSATSNALGRDGRLASGFNLVELYGQFELGRRGRWPLSATVHYVRNTQARDFFAAGPGGADVLVENGEDQGLWAELQIGRDVLRRRPEEVTPGDAVFNYTFARIEKDAVLTPFNFNNFVQQSDVRAHRLVAAYALDPRVALSLTSIFSRRASGLLGPFAPTPAGSLNRTLVRLQFDTIFRF